MNIKVGDTAPIAASTLKDSTDTPVNLTGASVQVRFAHLDGSDVTGFPKVATIVDAPTGQVSYSWLTGETAAAGAYFLEWVVTFANGKIETFPQRWKLEVLIDEVA